MNSVVFKQLVESLRYLTVTTSDLIYSVNLVNGYTKNPTEQHMLVAKRIGIFKELQSLVFNTVKKEEVSCRIRRQ